MLHGELFFCLKLKRGGAEALLRGTLTLEAETWRSGTFAAWRAFPFEAETGSWRKALVTARAMEKRRRGGARGR